MNGSRPTSVFQRARRRHSFVGCCDKSLWAMLYRTASSAPVSRPSSNNKAITSLWLGKRQEAARFDGFTPKAVNWYFDIRENEYGWIKPENTVNVDEGGIMVGFGLDSLVIGSSDPKKKAMLKGVQSRTWTSFIGAVTATGRSLKPGIIFKGKELQKQWFLNEFELIADWHYITSPNGWTDNHIALEWLKDVYLPQTEPRDASDARLIILDGHGSHAQVSILVFSPQSYPL
ncbi:hypothetical protein FOXG_22498 [Fusarium oxysporum f. sp. lycopersici 4287]|uniref:DDE-1 domain-containing protein n=1 Tax=Fusarium oxysporum f. sp. lycopersici (strain 4287 / CBS 123668 / FGSC 9935 / NRRL 34936) TaxID=426428 RepID=A0A0J9WVB8_FUSO4|nr:hypothetical protein FOXG_22498 [Fusarium oxysporum f. sp. lycopersici 4287]EWZ77885.1 hypothetical protein FOWG_17743 [Fusarium oxysporum f. sp. lycopersici MN25]KNB19257.1 hypothetical protein FOXG_22498 [Fusarium oxysporum f. sp. lycopersici 4287]